MATVASPKHHAEVGPPNWTEFRLPKWADVRLPNSEGHQVGGQVAHRFAAPFPHGEDRQRLARFAFGASGRAVGA